MHEKVDELEQESKLKNLRIAGMKEIEGENVAERIVDFAKTQLKLQIKPAEIDATRMGVVDQRTNQETF